MTPHQDESLVLDYQNEHQNHHVSTTRVSCNKTSVMDCTNNTVDISKVQNLENMLEDLNEEQFDLKCQEYFAEVPIKFKPKKGDKL